MEHTNLFLYEDNAALIVDYPNGKVDSPVPGVAYARADANSAATVVYNKKKTNYTVTVSHQDRSGNTVTANTIVETPLTVEGRPVKVNIVSEEVTGYKPVVPVEKIEVSQDTAHTCLYLTAVTYVVTVHYQSEDQTISADAMVNVPAFEDETVGVTLIPVEVEGYTAPEPVNIEVSGNMEYTFEYEKGIAGCFVDLGLPSGTLWACYNLGANSVYEVGNLYEWGEVVPRTVWCGWTDYRFSLNGTSAMTKYNDTDGKTVLDPEDDAATVELGPGYHTPTIEQWQELIDNTTNDILNPVYDEEHDIYLATFVSNNNGEKIYFPYHPIEEPDPNTAYSTGWLNQSGKYVLPESPEIGAYMTGLLCEGKNDAAVFKRNNTAPIRPVIGVGPSMEDLDNQAVNN